MGGIAATARHGDPFIGAVNFVIDTLEKETYTDAPDDAGGPTKFGISKRANPDLDIAALTRDDAIRVYHERYWRPCHADLFPPGIALQFFAAFVNMRPENAVRCVQRAAFATVDGVMGPQTVAAVQQFRPQSELRSRFSRECIEFYVYLVRRVPSNTKWLHGWLGRVCRVADEAGQWGGQE